VFIKIVSPCFRADPTLCNGRRLRWPRPRIASNRGAERQRIHEMAIVCVEAAPKRPAPQDAPARDCKLNAGPLTGRKRHHLRTGVQSARRPEPGRRPPTAGRVCVAPRAREGHAPGQVRKSSIRQRETHPAPECPWSFCPARTGRSRTHLLRTRCPV
jgi:hypothetical protein